jgi:hypothetical protein
MPDQFKKTNARCPYCLIYTYRRVLNPSPQLSSALFGPAFIPHIPNCPGDSITAPSRRSEQERFRAAQAAAHDREPTNMSNPATEPCQPATDEMGPETFADVMDRADKYREGNPDNREELVSVLRDGFGWTVQHDDAMGLTYTSPDRTTTVIFDNTYDDDLTVTRFTGLPMDVAPLWKVSMTHTTPTRVMLAVAMGA